MVEKLLYAKQVSKSFAGVQALKGVDIEIAKGEIHCLAGENGSGKSTLIKIISGVHEMDSGEIHIEGESFSKITPIEAIRKGIQVIYQDLSVFPNLTVMENLAYNTEVSLKRKLVSWKRFRKLAEEAVSKIDFDIDLDAIVSDLSIADKQLIAISRALLNNAKLIIMDEPTTALTKKEVKNLFRIIKSLQEEGIAILFVSHKLDEVFEISDKYTIFRNGENVKTGSTSELDNSIFTYYMTGREFKEEKYTPAFIGESPLLSVEHLSLKNGFNDVNFKLFKGEILGITGLLGSGRTELALSIFGYRKADSGRVLNKDGVELELDSIQSAINAGIGYVPEDRLTEGLFMSQSIERNVGLTKLDEHSSSFGFIDKEKLAEVVASWIEKLSIKTTNAANAVQTLSGGNQQRVVLAKWLAMNPDILILNGPTVGVDIGSKHDIHSILKDLAGKGLGVIVISDDIPEVMALCSRVLVMKSGEITNEYNTDEITEEQLSNEMTVSI